MKDKDFKDLLKSIDQDRKINAGTYRGAFRRIKLTREERAIEDNLEHYVPVGKAEFNEMARAIAARRKDVVLNIRVNRGDLEGIKQKAQKMGIKYQTFISEILHRVAQA